MSDYEMPEAFWRSWPKARKEHQCCECHNVIYKGESYFRLAGVWSGSFDHYKICSGCETLRELLREEGIETFYGGLFECMEESDHSIPAMAVLGAMAT